MNKVMMLMAFTLLGCIQPAKLQWHKKGISKFDTNTILAKCKYEVGINKVNPIAQIELIQNCMISQGFRWHA